MKQPVLTFALLMLVIPIAIAQDWPLTRSARTIIKFAPLSLLDPDATVQGAVEWPVGYRLAVQTEFGYGSFNRTLGGYYPDVAGKEVWRGRVEGRYYIVLFKTLNTGVYAAIEGLYKQINVTQLDTILSRVVGPSFVYAPVTKYVYALHTKLGIQFPLSDNSNSLLSHLLIDAYGGIGLRHIRIADRSTETMALFQKKQIYDRFNYHDYRPGDKSWRPSLALGLKIGFTL